MSDQTARARLYALSTAPTVESKGTCRTHGEFIVDVLVIDGQPLQPECPRCMRDMLEQTDRAGRQAAETVRVKALRQQRLNAIGLPPKLLGARYEDYKTQGNSGAATQLHTCKQFAIDWNVNSSSGKCLVMCGRPGTGKTMLASIMCKHIVSEHDVQPVYTTVSQMLRHIRASFGNSAAYTELAALKRFYLADLLVVDELGVKLSSDYDRATLFEIIDERYQRDLPTVVISNLTIDQIAAQTDERLVERLIEHGTLMAFDWDSHRGHA
jgi:DNA replication protein DnaC